MALFDFLKKQGKQEDDTVSSPVKILGSGCNACNTLEAHTKEALESLGQDTAIEHVRDFTKIAEYGVMHTPALVVDGEVLASGVILDTPKVKELIAKKRSL